MPDPDPLAELVAYLDDEADDATQRRLEARMSREPSLRAEADALKRTWDLLDHLPRPEPKADFTQRTMSRLAAVAPAEAVPEPVRRRVPWAMVLAASIAVVIGFAGAELALRARTWTPARLERDPLLASDPFLIDELALLAPVETVEFLKQLDALEPFGEERAP